MATLDVHMCMHINELVEFFRCGGMCEFTPAPHHLFSCSCLPPSHLPSPSNPPLQPSVKGQYKSSGSFPLAKWSRPPWKKEVGRTEFLGVRGIYADIFSISTKASGQE